MSLDTVLKLGYGMLVGTILLMVYASLTYAEHPHQPEQELIHPKCVFNPLCTCSNTYIDLGHVTCKDVPLPRIPREINTSRVYKLHLQNNGLRSLEANFLEGTGIIRMEVSHNNLTDVNPDAFRGLERSMWELDLHSNHLTSVPSRAIKQLEKLRIFNLTDNEITDIAAENWRGVEESLEVLSLRKNGIYSLPPEVFSSLKNLVSLDLSDNALLELGHNVFHDGPPRLVTLNLADNAISVFPYQQLATLKTLQHLDLSHNRISQLQNVGDDVAVTRVSLSLDSLRLDYNQLQFLPTRAFESFRTINSTYLDGNPISMIQTEAFTGSRIKELYLRDCGITELPMGVFAGLESSLVLLDLAGNNLTRLPHQLLHGLDFLRVLSFRDNLISGMSPAETLNTSKYSITQLDFSGAQNAMIAIQDLRGLPSIRSLTLSRLPTNKLGAEDFLNVGMDLRELTISNGQLKSVKNHAFKNIPSLEKLDLSENSINSIESEAFSQVGDSLTSLNLAAGLSSSLSRMPADAFRSLTALQKLDVSNNYVKSLPETTFHFMRNLQVLHVEDNLIDILPKGTFQGDIHGYLEKIFLSFNQLTHIATHSFVTLRRLDTLRLDDNKLGRVDSRAFMNLEKLKYLSMRGNKLTQLASEAFQNLPALSELDLAFNQLRNFEFSCLDQVGSLSPFRVNVSHNNLRHLEDNSSFYVSDRARSSGMTHSTIAELDFSHNNITTINRGYFRPVENSLTHLYLAHNSLRNLTRGIIGNMRHLQWLDVSHNRLGGIDFDSFTSPANLQVLKLSHNQIISFPNELFRTMHSLRIADMSYNLLRNLPDMFFYAGGLEGLRLGGNQLTRIPVNCFSSDAAASLIYLDVSDNAISALHPPDAYMKFPSLQQLDLSKNRIVRLDDGAFSRFHSLLSVDVSDNLELALDPRGLTFHGAEDTLQELYIRNASITQFPEMLLPELRLLDLSNNRFSKIPLELPQNLSSLRTLLLAGNLIDTVPTFLPNFTQLRTLSLARNQISQLAFGHGLRLRDLDIRHLPLESFEVGTLGRIPTLRSLEVSPNARDLNLPHLLQENALLERLHVEVWGKESGATLGHVVNGPFPSKLRHIQLSGRAINTIPNNFLNGVRSPVLELTVFNTTVEQISRSVFEQAVHVRSLRLDVRWNSMRKLANPNTATQPATPRKIFLADLKMAGNHWSCDCELGWVEGWERKKRQYFCKESWDSCRQFDDDLRLARCDNKQQQRMLEVLKTDIECGWNAAGHLRPTVLTALLVTVLALVNHRV